jgi:predicted transcriptional regulator
MSKQKKPGPGRPKTARPTVNSSCRLYVEIDKAISALAEENRRTKSAEMALAIEEWLRSRGKLPDAKKAP